jgi:hypothetical protein
VLGVLQTAAFQGQMSKQPCAFVAGGDDVQQLCDAGEEEFLEIMALVGMASKPLHVRRLQKALQEWVSNPGEWREALRPKTACPGHAKDVFPYRVGRRPYTGLRTQRMGFTAEAAYPILVSEPLLNPLKPQVHVSNK